jgi:hypothetical protein
MIELLQLISEWNIHIVSSDDVQSQLDLLNSLGRTKHSLMTVVND